MDDRDIIRQILDGEINQFELLVDKYRRKVFSVICKRVPVSDQELTAQDVFLKAFRSLSTFNITMPFENWLMTIAVRTCFDYWRSHHRLKQTKLVLSEDSHEEWLQNVEDAYSIEKFESEVSRKETLEILQIILKKLSPEDRLLIDMVYLEGWKFKDVAKILNWKLSKTKVRSMRAKHKMRKELEKLFKK